MEQWEKLVKLVVEFYETFGQKEFLSNEFTEDRKKLRSTLFAEELTEYTLADIENKEIGKLDAVLDMAYVHIGTLLERYKGDVNAVVHDLYFEKDFQSEQIWKYVIQNGYRDIFVEAFEEVHRSNMTKLDENGKPVFYTEGPKKGKIAKSNLFEEPQLQQFIERVGVK